MGGQRLGVRAKRTGHATKDPPRGAVGKSPMIPIGIIDGALGALACAALIAAPARPSLLLLYDEVPTKPARALAAAGTLAAPKPRVHRAV